MRNEGGEQPGFNLGQMLAEEEFYESNPELLRVRAFLEFCANGTFEHGSPQIPLDHSHVGKLLKGLCKPDEHWETPCTIEETYC